MFGRATIRLGISPHSSFYVYLMDSKFFGSPPSASVSFYQRIWRYINFCLLCCCTFDTLPMSLARCYGCELWHVSMMMNFKIVHSLEGLHSPACCDAVDYDRNDIQPVRNL